MDVTGSGPMIELVGVSKTYDDGSPAVADLSFAVKRGEIACLVGPSGCGKSTTLRMINRLIEPTSGTIMVDGKDVTKVDPVQLRRGIGYVIQQIGLFPHQRVLANVMTVPLLLGESKDHARSRAEEALSLVGLDPKDFGRRYPHQLSGGQQQRVGVARAIAARPPVLLMDEPFGAIDPLERRRLQDEFRDIQQEVGITVVFVTHDIDEAVKLGDTVAVFAPGNQDAPGGRLAQWGTPTEVLVHPADDFVSDFVGSATGLRRLSVVGLDRDALEPVSDLPAAASIDLSATLADAMVALLASDGLRVRVLDGGTPVGEVTPEVLQKALRTADAGS
jgi:osmoprotectant transport system ATP-binding protein